MPLTGIVVTRLEDTDTIKNAFEVCGPLIERITAVCQGPNEANKWVDLLSGGDPHKVKSNGNETQRHVPSASIPPTTSHVSLIFFHLFL